GVVPDLQPDGPPVDAARFVDEVQVGLGSYGCDPPRRGRPRKGRGGAQDHLGGGDAPDLGRQGRGPPRDHESDQDRRHEPRQPLHPSCTPFHRFGTRRWKTRPRSPSGRTSSITTMRAKERVETNRRETYPAKRLSITPSRSPPTMAPGTLPSPPRTAAVKPLRKGVSMK